MGAKHSKSRNKPPVPAPAAVSPVAPEASGAAATADAGATSWLDSSDPRKRLWGRIILAGIWVYVGALWLLALDQNFGWGLFGPKSPALP